jgi:hypothetical protein
MKKEKKLSRIESNQESGEQDSNLRPVEAGPYETAQLKLPPL